MAVRWDLNLLIVIIRINAENNLDIRRKQCDHITMNKSVFTSETQKGHGKWKRSLRYPSTFFGLDEAMFASGREEETNIIAHIIRHYRVVEYLKPKHA